MKKKSDAYTFNFNLWMSGILFTDAIGRDLTTCTAVPVCSSNRALCYTIFPATLNYIPPSVLKQLTMSHTFSSNMDYVPQYLLIVNCVPCSVYPLWTSSSLCLATVNDFSHSVVQHWITAHTLLTTVYFFSCTALQQWITSCLQQQTMSHSLSCNH